MSIMVVKTNTEFFGLINTVTSFHPKRIHSLSITNMSKAGWSFLVNKNIFKQGKGNKKYPVCLAQSKSFRSPGSPNILSAILCLFFFFSAKKKEFFFAMRLWKCFVDWETSTNFPSGWGWVGNDWIFEWTAPWRFQFAIKDIDGATQSSLKPTVSTCGLGQTEVEKRRIIMEKSTKGTVQFCRCSRQNKVTKILNKSALF